MLKMSIFCLIICFDEQNFLGAVEMTFIHCGSSFSGALSGREEADARQCEILYSFVRRSVNGVLRGVTAITP